MLRKVVIQAFASSLLVVGIAYAAFGFPVSGGIPQAASDSLICDPDGVEIEYVISGDMVTHIHISEIDYPACQGLQMAVNANDGSVVTFFPVTASSRTFNIVDVPVDDLLSVTITLTGPDS
ncbi:MAG TPA: hypothetical protein VFS30_06435 [Dehalococcoidia bacterium]|nr:hypothetical protein [Dehalococcoidia bacterium]